MKAKEFAEAVALVAKHQSAALQTWKDIHVEVD